MIKVMKKIWGILGVAVIAALILAVCYTVYCNITDNVAFVGKYATVRIISPSMEPEIPTNSYILVKKVELSELAEGDVILFRSSDPTIKDKLNTHRIIGIEHENGGYTFTTKGDNNTLKDFYSVSGEDVCAVYVKNVPWLSRLADFFSNPLFFFLLIILPALVLFFLAVLDVKKSIAEVKHQRRVEEEIKKLELAESAARKDSGEKEE